MSKDVELQRRVLDELDWEPSVDAAQIGVTVHEGVVALAGHVPHYTQKFTAEEVVKRVYGVKGVADDIEVRPPASHQRDDADIAAAAVHAIEWDTGVPQGRVQVTVREGWIVLEGAVDWQYQRQAAERAVRHLTGLRGVTNSILVQPGETTSLLKEDVEAALRRSAIVNSECVAVEIDGNTVLLTGDVHSHTERDEAERTAWAARGVVNVENCITVTPWGTGSAEEWGY